MTLRCVHVLSFGLLLCTIVACSGDKGTSPSRTGIQGAWPADAVGRYERAREYRFCPFDPLGCEFEPERIDTVEVCEDPTDAFVEEFLKGFSFPLQEVSGQVSDSLYYVVVKLHGNCDWVLTISTESTNQPPAKDGWQFTVVLDKDDACGVYFPGTYRYTYTRIGDGDCPSEGE